MNIKALAKRLENFYYNFDTYDYNDNLGFGQTRDDVVNDIYTMLLDSKVLLTLIDDIGDIIDEMDLDDELLLEAKFLYNELNKLKNDI